MYIYIHTYVCIYISISLFYNLPCFPSGTGLKIPPAAQQALQMTGAIPFGNMSGSSGEEEEDDDDINIH